MILMASGELTNFAGYASIDEYAAYIKTEFSNSLDLIYNIQNEINLSQLPVSPPHDNLLNNKTVTLYFAESGGGMKALQFSLTESILQISSTIFTISNDNITDYTENNVDVFFLMYNVFNDFQMAMDQSTQMYVLELQARTGEKEEISLVLYILVIIALVLCFVVLVPVVSNVNQQKDRVLSLFCEIDNSVLRLLAVRCERFMNSLQSEEGNDDIDSNDEMDDALPAEEELAEYSLVSGSGQRVKKAKGKTRTELGFYFRFFIALQIVHAYYLQNFLLNTQAVDAANVYTTEQNDTAMMEPLYWFALNSQREMINNNITIIDHNDPLSVVVAQMY